MMASPNKIAMLTGVSTSEPGVSDHSPTLLTDLHTDQKHERGSEPDKPDVFRPETIPNHQGHGHCEQDTLSARHRQHAEQQGESKQGQGRTRSRLQLNARLVCMTALPFPVWTRAEENSLCVGYQPGRESGDTNGKEVWQFRHN